MKYIFFTFLTALIFISCVSAYKPVARHSDNVMQVESTEPQIEITWKMVSNNYNGNNQFISELTIKNGNKFLINRDWELYFNFAPGRDILNTDNLKNVKIEHINGDFYKITPGTEFSNILPYDSLTIPVVASAWITKETEVPCGFYFVFKNEENSSRIVIPKFRYYPFLNKKQILRSENDLIPVPDAESRYLDNLKISILPNGLLKKIIPTPFITKPIYTRMELTKDVKIVYAAELQQEARYLSSELGKNLGKNPEIIKNQLTGENNIFLNIEKIKIEDKTFDNGSEAYSLRVQNGNIYITGTDKAGVFYAIQSLKALFPVESFKEPSGKIILDGIDILDKPRFGYRGMHLDVARNFQSKASVLKMLDLMAFYKMNKFHFHLSDDEGWRLEIPTIPELTEVGGKRGHTFTEADMLIPAYGSGPFPDSLSSAGSGYYSEQDFIDILKYASERHIEVIPEFDFPGHSRAAIVAMKSRYNKYNALGEKAKAEVFLLSDFNDESEYKSVQNFNDNVICVCKQSVYNFFEILVSSVARMYEKAGANLKTFHIGGDEVPKGVWEKSPACNSLKKANPEIKNSNDLKEYFITKSNEILKKYKLSTAGWEELGMHTISRNGKEVHEINDKFSNENFLLYYWNSVYGWGGEETGYKLANEGYKVVLSNVSPLYLDMAYDKDPQEPGFYWGGYVDEEVIFRFDPLDVYSSLITDLNGNPIPKNDLLTKTKLTEEGKKNILGIQAQLWSETVKTPERLEYMLLPRLIQVAEKAWAKEPEWLKNNSLYDHEWNAMMNSISQKELPRLDHINGGYNYRIPAPGAMIKNGMLYANSCVPGFEIYYTSDGSEPNLQSTKYIGPVRLNSKKINLKCISPGGKGGKLITIINK